MLSLARDLPTESAFRTMYTRNYRGYAGRRQPRPASFTGTLDKPATDPKLRNVPARAHAQLRLAAIRARKLGRIAAQPAYWPALRQGVAASVEHSRIPFGKGFATVLDVGASRGQFALFAARRFPGAKIHCFEPLPEPAADLRRVMGDRVELHRTAVGSSTGAAAINISARDDSSSLLPIGSRQEREFPGTGTESTIEVPLTTLDQAIAGSPERPCLLKIDVQGLELEVLKGAERTLGSVDVALVECSFVELYEGQALADEVVAFLLERGLRLTGVHEVVHSAGGSAIQADFLFEREQAPAP